MIKAWFRDENANIRRAASEGLRVWTSRKYFKEHPELVRQELEGWDLSSREVRQVHKLAGQAYRKEKGWSGKNVRGGDRCDT